MGNNDLSAFKALFLKTARTQIKTIKEAISVLEHFPKDQQALEKMYIASHSLKGETLAMSYASTGKVSFLLQKITQQAQENVLQLTPELLNLIKQAVSSIEMSLENIEKTDSELDLQDTQNKLVQISGITI
jgi:chemotaxis protein histidine kinase CheA